MTLSYDTHQYLKQEKNCVNNYVRANIQKKCKSKHKTICNFNKKKKNDFTGNEFQVEIAI